MLDLVSSLLYCPLHRVIHQPEGREMSQQAGKGFQKVAQAREYLKSQNYAFAGFGALTGAEVYKRDGKAVLLTRKAGQWVVA
jgi:hypothetical protein